MKNKEVIVFERSLAGLNKTIADTLEPEMIALIEVDIDSDFGQSDMDGWDYVFGASSAAASVLLSTNEDFEKWLAGVHDAANKQSGDYDCAQKALGLLFEHKGDYMDWMSTRFEGDDDPWRVFHRLFFGHDPLSFFADNQDNPFFLMVNQRGVFGALQVVRHLVADTFSKQGLPFPGHSYFEYVNDGGRPWSHLIDLVQNLSVDAYGNKGHAEQIYEHLLTIRAQDVVGGAVQVSVVNGYLKARGVTDAVRQAQVRLLAYSMAFFAQAIAGSTRQNGVPYINIPLGAAMTKELAALMLASNKRTLELERETQLLLSKSSSALERHKRLQSAMTSDLECLLPERRGNE